MVRLVDFELLSEGSIDHLPPFEAGGISLRVIER
jgi:hypothetical protein